MYNWQENFYKNIENVTRELIDLDISLLTHPISGDVRKKHNVEAIKQSIKSLVLMNHYEKPFHPDIGCDIYKSLFELYEGEFSKDLIKDNIYNVIENYEPRAELKDVIINVNESQNSCEIKIYFTPVNESETYNTTINIKVIR